MATFAFTVPPFTGHINPTLSLGSALLRKGHEVAWIALEESLEPHIPEGGRLFCVEHDDEDLKKEENERYLDTIEKKVVYGIDSIKYLYEDILIPLNHFMEAKITKVLDKFKPDLVINDHELFSGAIAAYKKNIPYATSITAPAAANAMDELPKIYEWIENKIIALQKACGVTIGHNITRSQSLNLVFTSHSFFGKEETLPDYYHFVGPVIQQRADNAAFDWDRFNQATYPKKILVSIGTTFDHTHKRDFFAKVIEALKDEPILVCVISDPDLFEPWPENFIVQSRIPQLDLLPHLDAVVCHGGHNTVAESLSNGLPMVVIPIAYDQQYVAGRVTFAEAGLRLNFKRFKAKNLKHMIDDVLSDPKYRDKARQIQTSFAEAGGTERAVTLLENMLVRTSTEQILLN